MSEYFHYQNGELFVENLALTTLAKKYGTPCYIYSRAALEQKWREFDQAFAHYPHRICYSVKANSNIGILNLLARLGSGFDIVSGGELARVLAAQGQAENIVFSGVGKQTVEIEQALEANIFCFNIESKAELDRLNHIAKRLKKTARIALRVNPSIELSTHPYIATGLIENKFGIALEDALNIYQHAASLPAIEIRGIACHIGSQILTTAPFIAALQRLLELIDQLKSYNIVIKHLDIGGGLGVSYNTEQPPTLLEYSNAILSQIQNRKLELILEPGRSLIAEAGILLTKIEYLKHHTTKNFAIVDAGMNDLIRPALYNAWHGILPVKPHTQGISQIYDIVGPVCESGDFLALTRHLELYENDLLAISSVGAYGFAMSSNYNSRPRAAEILVDKEKSFLLRQRETIADLFKQEAILPE